MPCHAPVDDDLDMVDMAMEDEDEDRPELDEEEPEAGGEGGVLLEDEDSEE